MIRPECPTIRDYLHSFVEGELDPIRTRMVEEHLAGCGDCRGAEDDLKLERLLLVESMLLSPALSESFTGKVLASVRRSQAIRSPAWRRRRATPLVGLAAACLLVAGGFALSLLQPEGDEREQLARSDRLVLPAPALPADTSPSPVRASLEKPSPVGVRHAVPRHELLLKEAARGTTPHAETIPSERGLVIASHRPASSYQAPSFGHVLGMAVQLVPALPSAEARGKDDPCKPDPNRDGKSDLCDVAYSCQVLISNQPPGALPDTVSGAAEDPDCDEHCYRA